MYEFYPHFEPKKGLKQGSNDESAKVLLDLYSHQSPEEAAESVSRIIGFFRAFCRGDEADAPSTSIS